MAAGTEITFDASDAIARLRAAGKELNPSRLTKLIGIDLLGWVDKNFQAEGIESGWEKLKQKTLDRRRKKGRGAKILQDTANLKNSYNPGGSGNVFNSGSVHVEVGTNVKTAPFHQFGTKYLPPRRMLPSDKTAEDIAEKAANAFVEHALKEAGL